MRKVLLGTVALLLVLIGLSFVTFGPDGGPLLRGRDVSSVDALVKRVESILPDDVTGSGQVRQSYKWRGAEGEWVYSTEPPPPGVDYQVVETDPTANVLPALAPERDE